MRSLSGWSGRSSWWCLGGAKSLLQAEGEWSLLGFGSIDFWGFYEVLGLGGLGFGSVLIDFWGLMRF